MNQLVGTLAALATAASWTLTSMAFERAGRRMGSMSLNFLRLVLGCLFLGIYGLATGRGFLPLGAGSHAWLWLGASGLVGLVLGDLLLFQAFIDIGARIAMLIYATAPAFTALLGLAILGEVPSLVGIAGMALTMGGIALVVLDPGKGGGAAGGAGGAAAAGRRPALRLRGLLLALGGALGQAGGLILSKLGAGSMDPFSGTQIRVTAALLGFALVLLAARGYRALPSALRDGRAVLSLTIGSFFGPFLGVSLSLLAVQNAPAGVASAIMSISPVLIIAPSAIMLKERVRPVEVLGAVLAVGGVFVLFLA